MENARVKNKNKTDIFFFEKKIRSRVLSSSCDAQLSRMIVTNDQRAM